MFRWLILLSLVAFPLLSQTATTDSAMNELLKTSWTAHAMDERPDEIVCVYGLPVVNGNTRFHVDSMKVVKECDGAIQGTLGALFFMPSATVELYNEDRGLKAACETLDKLSSVVKIAGYIHGIVPALDSLGKPYRAAQLWVCWR